MKTGQITPAVIIVGLLAAAVPLSLFATSIFIECFFVYWMVAGVVFHREKSFFRTLLSNTKLVLDGLSRKLGLFIHHPAAVAFSSLYMLFLAGCLWSSNTHYSLQELREKLPLLLLPILFTGISSFNEKEFRKILAAYIIGVFLGTLVGLYILLTKHIDNPRELSPFISHIRFSMNVCLAIFILFHFLVSGPRISKAIRLIFLVLVCWLAIFLFILKSLTGLSLFVAFLFYVIVYFSMKSKERWLRRGAAMALVIIPLLIFSFIFNIYNRHFKIVPPVFASLDTKTAGGNPYTHDTLHFKVENGQYIGLYLCEKELKESWERRSNLNYNGRNLQGDELRYTIIRYLNSKGYRKDAVGLAKLSPFEISSIEKGVANAGLVQPFNLSARIEGIFTDYERYKKTGNANGKSELQRLEYWKAAISIMKQNLFFGVGTGDALDAFTDEYKTSHSTLEIQYWAPSHNQYLYMGVTFGIIGLILFLCWLVFPPLYLGAFKDYYFVALFCIMIISMLTDDTIRTQAGLNFMAFFGCLFLFGRDHSTQGCALG